MKIVKESLNEELHGKIKIHDRTYDAWSTPNGTVHIGEDGVLGNREVLVSWDIIKKLMPKYTED